MELEVQNVPVSQIGMAANIRFGLKKTRIDSMAEDISVNGILNPLTIMVLAEPQGDIQYQLILGNYRFTAVGQLNDKGAGVESVPCVIRDTMTPAEIMKLQMSENNERENMTPMDQAVAIRDLLAEGESKTDIRKMFAVPGGRKGNAVQPVSYSWLGMRLSFLEFPKAIQNKIHTGMLTVLGAYKLSKVPKDKWEAVMADAEAERLKAVEVEEKDEERLLAQEAKEVKEKEAADKLLADLEAAKGALTEKSSAFDAAAEAEANALKTMRKGAADDAEKAKLADEYKAAQDKVKAALKETEDAKKAADALEAKRVKMEKAADERKAKLAALRAGQAPAATGASAIDKASAAAGSPSGSKPLNRVQIMDVIKQMALPGSYPKVQEIGKILENCFSGAPGCYTDKQAFNAIAVVTGEKEAKPAKAPKADKAKK